MEHEGSLLCSQEPIVYRS